MRYDIHDYIEGIVPEGASILCPFHDDHLPSAVCIPGSRLFYCFGCRIVGDQTEIAKRLWFPEDDWPTGMALATAFLKKNRYPIVTNQYNEKTITPSPAEDPRLSEVMTQWCRFCNENLMRHPKVIEAIQRTRAIQNPVGLGLGLAGYDVFYKFTQYMKQEDPHWNLEGDHLTSRCGITFMVDERMVPYDQRYKLSDRIIIPEIRENKRVIYFQARAQQKEHKLRYLNPKGMPRPVFGWESLKRPTEVVWFVEGVFDMLPLIEADQSAISCNGLGFNDRILEDIKANLNGRTLLVAFDNDPPDTRGESRGILEGAKRVARLKEGGVNARQIIPPCKDMGEWITLEGVHNVISSVIWSL